MKVKNWNHRSKLKEAAPQTWGCPAGTPQICRMLWDPKHSIFSWNVSNTEESENAQPYQQFKPSNTFVLWTIWKIPNHKRDMAERWFIPQMSASNMPSGQHFSRFLFDAKWLEFLQDQATTCTSTSWGCCWRQLHSGVWRWKILASLPNSELWTAVLGCRLNRKLRIRCQRLNLSLLESPLGKKKSEHQNMDQIEGKYFSIVWQNDNDLNFSQTENMTQPNGDQNRLHRLDSFGLQRNNCCIPGFCSSGDQLSMKESLEIPLSLVYCLIAISMSCQVKSQSWNAVAWGPEVGEW